MAMLLTICIILTTIILLSSSVYASPFDNVTFPIPKISVNNNTIRDERTNCYLPYPSPLLRNCLMALLNLPGGYDEGLFTLTPHRSPDGPMFELPQFYHYGDCAISVGFGIVIDRNISDIASWELLYSDALGSAIWCEKARWEGWKGMAVVTGGGVRTGRGGRVEVVWGIEENERHNIYS